MPAASQRQKMLDDFEKLCDARYNEIQIFYERSDVFQNEFNVWPPDLGGKADGWEISTNAELGRNTRRC